MLSSIKQAFKAFICLELYLELCRYQYFLHFVVLTEVLTNKISTGDWKDYFPVAATNEVKIFGH